MSAKVLISSTFRRLLNCNHNQSTTLLQNKVAHRTCNRHAATLESVKRRVFSGIQPTGIPHLGNYFGAIKPWVKLQEECDDIILSVVDLHSMTVLPDPLQLRQSNLEMMACLLACGIDPNRTILFQQSAVSEHCELAWILGCLTTLPRLQHLPQWKIKSEAMKEVPLGLFTYPVLQVADILLYKATEVPVGDDQIKHIELARHIAKLFNTKYGPTFPKPKAVIGNFNKIRSLRNPEAKMSKSESNPLGKILITDSPVDIQNKLRKAVSDTTPKVTYDPSKRPGMSNLVDIHAAFTGLSPAEICDQSEGLDTLQYKMLVADVIIDGLAGVREKYLDFMNNKDHLKEVINSGNVKAKEIAQQHFRDIKTKCGLL